VLSCVVAVPRNRLTGRLLTALFEQMASSRGIPGWIRRTVYFGE
jgi:hypothetical protein